MKINIFQGGGDEDEDEDVSSRLEELRLISHLFQAPV